ncbi:MAG: monovalent cation/H+ antiporter complex subunit F [Eubacteriales bacterium]
MEQELLMKSVADTVLIVIIAIQATILCLYLVRAIRGPKLADRLVAANMASTLVIVMIAMFSYIYNANYLIDICMIYAMISFLSVIVLSKVYVGADGKAMQKEEE